MSSITTRAGKGSPLTNTEVDNNFTNLNDDKYEAGDSPSFAGLTVDTDTLYVDSANNRVGIGTSSPLFDIDVRASSNATIRVGNSSDSVAKLSLRNTGSLDLNLTQKGGETVFSHGSSERMRIDSSGRVGIGTSSPVGQLDVRGGNIFTSEAYSFTSNSSTPSAQAAIYRPAANTLGFSTAASEAMRIDSSGRVGIGTSSPSSILHVSGTDEVITQHTNNTSGNVQQHISLRRGGGSGIDGRINSVGDGSNGVSAIAFAVDGEVMRIDSSGRVGIGTSNPSTTLDVNGSLSKNSGSFKIDHPVKPDTHHLVHSFVEGPQADNLYRGKVTLVDGLASVNLDEAGRMTEGTFVALNGNVQCWTTNEDGWTQVRGKVEGNTLIIEAQDPACTDEISWLVIGERHDQHMMDTEWTDENGRVITEPVKENTQ